MKKLVQKLFEINDHIANGGPEVLQSFLDRVSADGWEYCGMLSDYYIFKRWEEKTTVSDTGRFENKKPENNCNCQQNAQYQPQFNYQPQYQPPYNPYPFNNYQKPYTGGYQPYGQPMGTPYGYNNNHPYNPNPNAGFNNSPFNASSFGTKVDEEDSSSNPFEE